MSRSLRSLILVPLAAVAFLFLLSPLGCSDSTAPRPPGSGLGAGFNGAIDPHGSSFVLKRVEATEPGQAPVAVDLIGGNLAIDATNEVISLDVAIHNVSGRTLYPPAIVALSNFDPPAVTALEPTLDYSALLGDDHALTPGETSGALTWRFHAPGLPSFAFAAAASFGGLPPGPIIAGTVFNDANGNGLRDPGEGPFFGTLTLVRPDGVTMTTSTADSGAYQFPITEAGLHTITYTPPPTFAAVIVTTPNPLRIMIVLDEQGAPRSYLHADFGVCNAVPPPGNLITNGSFEVNGQPSLAGWVVQTPALTSVVPGGAPGAGQWALRLNADWLPAAGVVRAPLPGVQDGEVLALSAWIRAIGQQGGGFMFLESGHWLSPAAGSRDPDWKQVALTVTVSVAPGDSLWLVLSAPGVEVVSEPTAGLFDGVVAQRAAVPLSPPAP